MQIIRVRLCSEKTKGCEKAGIEVLKSLKEIKNNESGKVIDFDKLNLEEIHLDLNNKEEAHYLIFENSKEIFEKNSKAFFIGGDQSIDYSILRGFNKVQEGGLLIVFNARGDCLDDVLLACPDEIITNSQNEKEVMVSDSELSQAKDRSHSLNKFGDTNSLVKQPDEVGCEAECGDKTASRGKQINSEITNKNWLRKLIEKGFSGSRIVLIGIRSISLKEIEFLKENNVTLIRMDLLQEDLQGVCDLVMERARDSRGFYISLDISCVDPSSAPGVSLCEPGGLSSREIIYFIKRLLLLDNFQGCTISEINVEKDINGMTIKLGAKLLGEMI